jgi:hypothetical protein
MNYRMMMNVSNETIINIRINIFLIYIFEYGAFSLNPKSHNDESHYISNCRYI